MALWIICLLASIAYALYSCLSLGTQLVKPVDDDDVPVATAAAAPTMGTRTTMRRPKVNHEIDSVVDT
jgi:hypothetical protein